MSTRQTFVTMLSLLWALSTAALAASGPVTSEDAAKWKAAVSSTNAAALFDGIGGLLPTWPSVHSSEQSGATGNRDVDVQYTEVAHGVIRGAKEYLDAAPGSGPAKNRARFQSALNLREKAGRGGGYVNLVLADAMTRAGFVYLCREFGSGQPLGPEFDRSLSALKSHEVSYNQWVQVAAAELGWSPEVQRQYANAPSDEAGLHKLWDALTNGDDVRFPKSLGNLCSDDLLVRRDLSMLLYRYINMDVALKRLSLAAEYRQRATEFSLQDNREKVAAVLNLQRTGEKLSVVVANGAAKLVSRNVSPDKTKLSIGERFLNQPVSPEDVAGFLHDVESGRVYKFMPFYRSEVVPARRTHSPSHP